MADRKTGVIPLDLITAKDRDRYTDEELVEYILKILQFLKTGEEPIFSGRGLQEKFEGREHFLKTNMQKYDRKLENLKQFQTGKTESEPSRNRIGTESNPNGHVRYEICDMRYEIKEKINKKKKRSNIIEHDYSKIDVQDPRKEVKA